MLPKNDLKLVRVEEKEALSGSVLNANGWSKNVFFVPSHVVSVSLDCLQKLVHLRVPFDKKGMPWKFCTSNLSLSVIIRP